MASQGLLSLHPLCRPDRRRARQAASFAIAYPGATAASPWACYFNPQGGGGNNGVICRRQ
jgi:hypothetical protein